jgi:hypothetical protein
VIKSRKEKGQSLIFAAAIGQTPNLYTFNVPNRTAMAILRNILQSFTAGLVYCQLLVVFCCLFVHHAKTGGALAYETDSIKDGKPEPQIFQLTLGARVFFFSSSTFLSSPFENALRLA